ncbi:MAG: polyprenyl synthetase family protein [Candidatus Omnitrophota bacterium]|nr:polyprenyl synthetase family protein [Candidatus Omnitrophota bacterium]
MQLKGIYQLIKKELIFAEEILEKSLKGATNKSILEISDYLLEAKGKRLRPALVIFSAKASQQSSPLNERSMISVACAMELIHTASLIHDDVIDHASLRHNKPTINSKYGQDVSIAVGDYLYSIGFELISSCRNTDILSCVSQATKAMCEGELIQVCERDNLDLLKKRYIIIAKKKTASLFVASCQAGAMLSNSKVYIQHALKGYGLNFGIAFQIIDDYLDLTGKTEDLGKSPGADFKMGELTLPILNLLTQTKDRNRLMSLIKQQDSPEAFRELKQRFINSRALLKTKEDVCFYAQEAKKELNRLKDSCFKQSLFNLADYLVNKMTI